MNLARLLFVEHCPLVDTLRDVLTLRLWRGTAETLKEKARPDRGQRVKEMWVNLCPESRPYQRFLEGECELIDD